MKVVIVGAGMSGLCMGVALERARIPYVILEKSPALGGTWWENTYPGCACDIPSHLYAFSFAPEPGWSRVYPTQPEILAYLRRLADSTGVASRIRFGVEVKDATWDQATSTWRVRAKSGELFEGDVLVSAIGALHVPKYSKVPGRERFSGPSFHSARWDHAVELRGKRVGVIGNGASAVQFVPIVAEQAAHLTIFQRSAHWILDRDERTYPPLVQGLFRTVPAAQRLYRGWLWLEQEAAFLAVFGRSSWIGRALRARLTRRLRRRFKDPALRAALTPDYALGCKRALISNDYYPALQRPNVRVVTDALQEIDERGVRTAAGRHDLDVLIHATGFQPLAPDALEVIGRGGRRLRERFGERPRAHLGMTVPGFPNYFLLLGPSTGLGHNSVMWMVERQVQYVLRCLRALEREGRRTVEVTEAALARYVAWLDRRMPRTVFEGCRSWYQNDAGEVYALWPATTARYAWATRRPRPGDFVFA